MRHQLAKMLLHVATHRLWAPYSCCARNAALRQEWPHQAHICCANEAALQCFPYSTHIWGRQPCIQVIMETSHHASGIIKVGCEMSANHQVIINTNEANKSKSGRISLHEPSHEHLCATSVWTDSCCNPEFQISRLSAGLQSPRLRTGKNCEQSWLVKCAGKKGLKINKYRNQMWFLQCINFLPPGTSTLLQAERCWAMPLKRDLCLLEKGIFCKHLPAECRSSTIQIKSAAVLMYDKAFLYDVFVSSCRAQESKCCISLTLSISTWCSRPTAAVWDLRFQARNETKLSSTVELGHYLSIFWFRKQFGPINNGCKCSSIWLHHAVPQISANHYASPNIPSDISTPNVGRLTLQKPAAVANAANLQLFPHLRPREKNAAVWETYTPFGLPRFCWLGELHACMPNAVKGCQTIFSSLMKDIKRNLLKFHGTQIFIECIINSYSIFVGCTSWRERRRAWYIM